jgi:hypothetical protein
MGAIAFDRVSSKYKISDYGDINMTLAEVIPAARRLTAIEKLKLIRVLVEDLDIAEDIAPIEPFKTYDLPTPYDMFGAGAILMEALKQTDTTHQ